MRSFLQESAFFVQVRHFTAGKRILRMKMRFSARKPMILEDSPFLCSLLQGSRIMNGSFWMICRGLIIEFNKQLQSPEDRVEIECKLAWAARYTTSGKMLPDQKSSALELLNLLKCNVVF